MKYFVAITLLVVSCFSYAEQPSFDCTLASTKSENEICDSAYLSRLDKEMSVLYRYGMKIFPGEKKKLLKESQKNWLEKREKPFPNLKKYMESRVRSLNTSVFSPEIHSSYPPTNQEYSFEFVFEIDAALLTESLVTHLNGIAHDFLSSEDKIADRYVGMTAAEFNRIKPMRVYFGPAELSGITYGEKSHCYDFWQLRISLGGKWVYLNEFFNASGEEVRMPSSKYENYKLHRCEAFGGGVQVVFWTNSYEAARSGDIDKMELSEYVYNKERNQFVEISRYIK